MIVVGLRLHTNGLPIRNFPKLSVIFDFLPVQIVAQESGSALSSCPFVLLFVRKPRKFLTTDFADGTDFHWFAIRVIREIRG